MWFVRMGKSDQKGKRGILARQGSIPRARMEWKSATNGDQKSNQAKPPNVSGLHRRTGAPSIKCGCRIYPIIAELAAKIAEVEGPAAAAAFSAKHLRVLKELTVVSHHTRTTEMLTPLQLNELEDAYTKFGEASRESYD